MQGLIVRNGLSRSSLASLKLKVAGGWKANRCSLFAKVDEEAFKLIAEDRLPRRLSAGDRIKSKARDVAPVASSDLRNSSFQAPNNVAKRAKLIPPTAPVIA